MKSRTLNNNHRDTICGSIVSDTFKADDKKIKEAEGDLAMECYNALYTQAERDTLKRLGKGWFDSRSGLQVRFGAKMESVAFQQHGVRRVKDVHSGYGTQLSLDATDPLADKLTKFFEEKSDHGYATCEFRGKVMAQLNSVRTTKQLLAAWPEVETWLPTALVTEHAPAPMIQVTEINKVICDKLGPKGGTCGDGK
jgi:hypothetical protein